MSKEQSFAKTIAGFETLISFCTGYGSVYNPSNNVIKVANMQTLLNNAKAAIADVQAKETIYSNTVDARIKSFENLKSLSTKLVNAFAVSGVADTVVESAKTINRKLQGVRATALPKQEAAPPVAEGTTPPPDTATTGSASQQSYEQKVEHITLLVELVSTHVEYKPNEVELQVASLQTYITSLRTANTNVINAKTDYSNSRLQRDAVFQNTDTGLLDVMLASKAYIKSVFGATSAQYTQVKGL